MKITDNNKVDETFYAYPEAKEAEAAKQILEKVKREGDRAVMHYSKKFDNNPTKRFELTQQQITAAYQAVSKEVQKAIGYALENIRDFASMQLSCLQNLEIKKPYGILGQKIVPLQRVGCYVPGGRYPLLSSALMSVAPAKIAGVKEIIVCSPNIKPEVIVAADMAGADKIFSIGGVQAIAAMAYGTKQVLKVDKIVGPGNAYVTAAKRLCFGDVGIDMLAGPSELLIIADDSADKDLIQADLAAQKEHDENAKVWLLEVSNPKDIPDVIRKANEIAPEHIELIVRNPEAFLDKLSNYGSLFIGPYSGAVFGDYCSGTNHILPTGGTARYRGGLSVMEFVKIVTYQQLVYDESLTQTASTLAGAEGLLAHQRSALSRKLYKQKPREISP